MNKAGHDDETFVVSDLIHDSARTSMGIVEAGQFALQRPTHPMRVRDQRAKDELDDCRRGPFRHSLQLAVRRTSHAQVGRRERVTHDHADREREERKQEVEPNGAELKPLLAVPSNAARATALVAADPTTNERPSRPT